MKAEQLEIDRLRREVAKLKAERDILKKGRGLLREGVDMKFGFIAKHVPSGRWHGFAKHLAYRGLASMPGRNAALARARGRITRPLRALAGG